MYNYSGCNCTINPTTGVTLGGQITGTDGPVSGVTTNYTVKGVRYSTSTDSTGRYSFSAPRGSSVTITPQPGLGVTVRPPYRSLRANQSYSNLDFTLSPVVPF